MSHDPKQLNEIREAFKDFKSVARGYWRNRWKRAEGFDGVLEINDHEDLTQPMGDGTWLGAFLHDTRADAEREAANNLQHNAAAGVPGIYVFLGAEFFPEAA